MPSQQKDPQMMMFNGLVYKNSHGKLRNKSDAEELARELRSWGNLARIVSSRKIEGLYVVYIRGTSHKVSLPKEGKLKPTKNRYKKVH